MNVKLSSLFACSAAGAMLLGGAETALAQAQPPANHPAVTVRGQTYTPASILARNMGSEADRVTQFPPHKIIGNIYYVGTRTLSSFLITTPQGDILIDTTYERNAPVIEKSIMDLGFKLSDVKIILGTHAHGDHQEGDAVFKQKTGAQFVAMAEDVPLLKAMKPEGKEHPVDRIIHDGDLVTLGGTTLVAHLTPGHTPGCTSWTTTAQEGGKTYNVVIGCSLRPPATVTPQVEDELTRAYKTVRALPCDILLGDHGAQYNMQEKYAKLKEGAPNPFIDPAGCTVEADVEEAMMKALLVEQKGAK